MWVDYEWRAVDYYTRICFDFHLFPQPPTHPYHRPTNPLTTPLTTTALKDIRTDNVCNELFVFKETHSWLTTALLLIRYWLIYDRVALIY